METSALEKAIGAGMLHSPHDVGDGCVCYDVDQSWRGMTAFLDVVDPFDFGCSDWRFLPPHDDNPLRIETYGRWLMDFSPTKHVLVHGGDVVMYEYRMSGMYTSYCVCRSAFSDARSHDELSAISRKLRDEPVRVKEEMLQWTDERSMRFLESDMESSDEHVRASVPCRFPVKDMDYMTVCRLADDPSPIVRASLARSIVAGMDTAVKLMGDPDWRVRRALFERRFYNDGLWGEWSDIPRLAKDDPEFEVRAAFAAWAYERTRILARSSGEFKSNLMTMLLDDPDERIRSGVAMALLDKEE